MGKIPAYDGGKPAFKEKVHLRSHQLFDLTHGWHANMLDRVKELSNGFFVRKFENNLKRKVGDVYVAATSSCTDGLVMALLAYKARMNNRNQKYVIVPAFTFSATVHAIKLAGLSPCFVDIDESLCLCPLKLERMLEQISPQVCAILGVHVFGLPADMNAIHALGEQYSIPVLYDAAHAIGASYEGQKLAEVDTCVYSFSPTKPVTCGEGGAVATKDRELYEAIVSMRNYAKTDNDAQYFNVGLSARMSELNAIYGILSLSQEEKNRRLRNGLRNIYYHQLSPRDGILVQRQPEGRYSSNYDFTIFIDADEFGCNRDDLAVALAAENIETRKYFPNLKSTVLYGAELSDELELTDEYSRSALSLPMHTGLKPEDAFIICDTIIKIQEYQKQDG